MNSKQGGKGRGRGKPPINNLAGSKRGTNTNKNISTNNNMSKKVNAGCFNANKDEETDVSTTNMPNG